MNHFTRVLISGASAVALSLGTVTPAFAYFVGEPPLPVTVLRQRSELREAYADSYPSITYLSRMQRDEAVADTTGRSLLARSLLQTRLGQRNYRRHVLGFARGFDYRVLNVNGDVRRIITSSDLPLSIIQTGNSNNGTWNYDRPTRRDIRENGHYCVYDRNRFVPQEQVAYCTTNK